MSLTSISNPTERAKLRKIRTLPVEVKTKLYGGARGPEVTMQFNRDLRLCGLWEALLYAEKYEENGEYTPGTVQKAFEAAVGRKEA